MNLVKKNIFILVFIQGINYLFPLLTIPFLSRVFGPEGIGALTLAQAIILYLGFIVDFGFGLTVTRKISLAEKNKDQNQINNLFTQTLILKIVFFIVLVFFAGLISQFVESLSNVKQLIYIGFFSLLGAAINPVWLFQGLQKMNTLIIPAVLPKIVVILLIFNFIHTKQDINLAMLLLSINALAGGIISFYFIFKMNLASFCKIKLNDCLDLTRESFYIFISYLGTSFYTTLNTFIMSFYVNLKQLGIYSSAEKVTSTAQSLMIPISQAIFPNLASFNSKNEYISNLKKYGLFLFFVSSCITFSLYFLSKLIILTLFGMQFKESIHLLQVLSFLPMVVSIGIIFGQWGLVIIGQAKLLGKIYLFFGCLHLTYVFVMLMKFGIFGAAISILITETLISFFLFLMFVRQLKKWVII